MKIQPHLSYRLLGTALILHSGKTYEAEHANNQPDWEEKGKIFVKPNPALEDTMLLERGDYTIIEP